MADGEFSVFQFFSDTEYECVCKFVDARTASQKAVFFTSNVAARMGITKKVIITDGGDNTNWEWQYGKGVIFPLSKVGDSAT
jgi:hypothetical protein